MTYRTHRRPGSARLADRTGSRRPPLRLAPVPIITRAELRADYLLGGLVAVIVALSVILIAQWLGA